MERYKRQIIIDSFGIKGQERLRSAKVLVVGAGGLGSAICYYLTAAGVGRLGIVDSDRVDEGNLQRQILHTSQDIGRYKVDSAKEKLERLNPEVKIDIYPITLNKDNITDLIDRYDMVVDALDNIRTRMLVNREICIQRKPFFHGAVWAFEGRALTILPGRGACLACFMSEDMEAKGEIPVLGTTPAIIGCIEATEVIKYIVGIGELLVGRYLVYDGLNMEMKEFRLNRNPRCIHCRDI